MKNHLALITFCAGLTLAGAADWTEQEKPVAPTTSPTVSATASPTLAPPRPMPLPGTPSGSPGSGAPAPPEGKPR